jgi:hypothetical protein
MICHWLNALLYAHLFVFLKENVFLIFIGYSPPPNLILVVKVDDVLVAVELGCRANVLVLALAGRVPLLPANPADVACEARAARGSVGEEQGVPWVVVEAVPAAVLLEEPLVEGRRTPHELHHIVVSLPSQLMMATLPLEPLAHRDDRDLLVDGQLVVLLRRQAQPRLHLQLHHVHVVGAVLARVPLLVAAPAKGHGHKGARDAAVVSSHTVTELDLVSGVPSVTEGAECPHVLLLLLLLVVLLLLLLHLLHLHYTGYWLILADSGY